MWWRWICGGQSGTGTCFCTSTSTLLISLKRCTEIMSAMWNMMENLQSPYKLIWMCPFSDYISTSFGQNDEECCERKEKRNAVVIERQTRRPWHRWWHLPTFRKNPSYGDKDDKAIRRTKEWCLNINAGKTKEIEI